MDEKQIAAQLEHLEFEVKVGLKTAALPQVLSKLDDLHARVIEDFKKSFVAKLFPEYQASEAYPLAGGDDQRLENTYFDTEDSALYSQCYAGLRLRRYSKIDNLRIHKILDDDRVEQTLKLKGKESGAAHSHLEYNIDVPAATTTPDLKLFSDVKWPENVDLDALQTNLKPRYTTDFHRCAYTFTLPAVGKVEMAFDNGYVSAGSVERVIGEIEIELKSCDEMAKLFSQMFDTVNLEDMKLYLTNAFYTYIKLLEKQIKAEFDLYFFALEPLSKLKRAVTLENNAYYLQTAPAVEIFLADQDPLPEDVLKADLTPLARAEAFGELRKRIMALYGKARLFFPGYEKDTDRLLSVTLNAYLEKVKETFGENKDDLTKDLVLKYLAAITKKDISRSYYESAYIAELSFYMAKSLINGVNSEHVKAMCDLMSKAH